MLDRIEYMSGNKSTKLYMSRHADGQNVHMEIGDEHSSYSSTSIVMSDEEARMLCAQILNLLGEKKEKE
jgi:hypothetical protein